MKAIIFLSGLGITAQQAVQAQSTAIRVKTDAEAAWAIPVQERYRYPVFTQGNLQYAGGQTAAGRLNYNLLLAEVQFIDPKGDTLSLANEEALTGIRIGEELYHYDPVHGYLEVTGSYQAASFARKQVLRLVRSEKEGAYGQSTAVSSIKSYNSVAAANSQVYKLQGRGDLVFRKDVSYFLIDSNRRTHKATRGNFLKVFVRHRKTVDEYIKNESVNFHQEEDLRKLLQFISQLP